MAILTPIAWVFAMIGLVFIATVIFAFLGIAMMGFAAFLMSIGAETGE